VYISYPDSVISGGLVVPLAMTALASVLCVIVPLRQALLAPVLSRQEAGWQSQRVAQRDLRLFLAGVVTLMLAFLVGFAAESLWAALSSMAGVLLGSVFCLPAILRAGLSGLARLVPPHWARSRWLLADSRWLIGPASIALMAMTLALVSNSGLNTMISSFRQATDDWLQQRLVAQLYVRADLSPLAVENWLVQNATEVNLAKRFQTGIVVQMPGGHGTSVSVISMPLDDLFLDSISLMQTAPDAARRFARGEGVYISERAWRLDGWKFGDRISPCDQLPGMEVIGVYRDYGNTQSQWIISQAVFNACWPGQRASGYALYGPSSVDWDRVELKFAADFGIDARQLIDQRELKSMGLSVFDRTFVVTRALNALTLLVAGIGIFCSISAIHHHRLREQALLASMGVSRPERAVMQLAQWGLLGLLCVIVVWPMGTALAWVLAAVVTPVAFGWSFGLQLDWQHYPVLLMLAFSCLFLAVLLPGVRLLRVSPGEVLKEEAT
jgi:putative ABC transport system permease protein